MAMRILGLILDENGMLHMFHRGISGLTDDTLTFTTRNQSTRESFGKLFTGTRWRNFVGVLETIPIRVLARLPRFGMVCWKKRVANFQRCCLARPQNVNITSTSSQKHRERTLRFNTKRQRSFRCLHHVLSPKSREIPQAHVTAGLLLVSLQLVTTPLTFQDHSCSRARFLKVIGSESRISGRLARCSSS